MGWSGSMADPPTIGSTSRKLSGAKRERPQLQAAVDYMRDGDTLVVWKLEGRQGQSLAVAFRVKNATGPPGSWKMLGFSRPRGSHTAVSGAGAWPDGADGQPLPLDTTVNRAVVFKDGGHVAAAKTFLAVGDSPPRRHRSRHAPLGAAARGPRAPGSQRRSPRARAHVRSRTMPSP
jgi:hypothetical protein